MTTESEKLPWRLLYAGGASFFLLGIFTAWLGPNSAASLEARLQEKADQALASANLTSWSAHTRGAAIELEGVAASEADKREVMQALKAATGNGDVRADKVILAPLADPFVWTARKETTGFVTIEGVAPSRQSLIAIQATASRLYPSKMINRTTLASGAPEGVDWSEAAVHGLEALLKLERGEARLSDDELTVSGLAASDTEALAATTWLMRVKGGAKVRTEIIGPPEWIASAEDRKIVMQGKVASAETQHALLRAASVSRPAVDKTYVAGTGRWQRRAVKAVSALAQFDRGEIIIQGKVFRIKGEAPGSVLGFLREDMADIADDYQIEYAVSETEPNLSGFPGLNLSQSRKPSADTCQSAFQRVAGANRIVFVNNRAEISRVSGASLDRLVAVARICSAHAIEIQGHTDGTGRRAANLTLSRARAEAIKDYLVGRGLSADRLTAVGFGPDRPIASNRSESGRARNRRIEFRILRGETR